MSGYNYGFGMATPEKIAKIQDEQAERERARRVKEANLAAFDAARDAERNGRGGSVSVTEMGPGGRVTSFSNTTIGPDGSVQREGFGDAWNLQGRVGSEFADISRRSAMAQRHNAQLGTDSVSAAMRAAMANGGRLPQNLVGLLSRNLGMDGNNQSVFSAGFLNNGDFDIDIVTRGANGGLQRTTKKISPREQLGIVNSTPGVWGNDGIAVSQRLYDGLRNTMGKSELPPQGVYANNLRQYNTQKQSADTIKMMTGLYQAVYKDLSKGGKQPVTTDMIRARMAADMLKDPKVGPQITSVPDLNEDGTQKMVEDENGKPVPAMRQADSNNPDDVERVKQNLKMRLDLVPELAPRQDAQGGGEADGRLAFLKYIYDRENPPTPPDVLKFQQGQRERQMRQVEEAQAREDVTRRPQQVINYFKDGKWYSGNGYIRDGKVYDGQGYEIEGATPAEMARGNDGGVVSNERGWFARALPSARELVGGGAGRGNAGEGAAQGEQQPAAQATQGEQPVATQPAQDGQPQPAAAQDGDQKEQAGAQSGDLLAPENADAFIADVNKGLDPEISRAIEIEAAAKAEKARRQKQSAEPIGDREWAETMKSANESTGGVVQRDRGAESRTAARDFFSSVFDDIARDAMLAADRAVAFDEKYVGAGKGISRDEAYRNAFRSLVNKRLGEMSEEDRRRLERVDPGNLKSLKINLRQSLYDRYGVDVYDGGRGFVGAITGVGNLDNRGGYYEDLVDSDGNVKKGTWRRGGDAYNEYGRSVSLWR